MKVTYIPEINFGHILGAISLIASVVAVYFGLTISDNNERAERQAVDQQIQQTDQQILEKIDDLTEVIRDLKQDVNNNNRHRLEDEAGKTWNH